MFKHVNSYFLFTGDLEMEGEKLFLEEYQNTQMQEASGRFEQSDEAGRKEGLEFVQDERLEPVQDEFVENGKYEILEDSRYALLKVGHHGSKTSSSTEFINETNPKYSIISVGKNNRYGHPNKEVLNNLDSSKIYRTDQDGSIMFKIKNNKLKIETCSP